MMNHNIYSIFEQHFPVSREAIFIETQDGDTYSYATLEQEVSKIAHFLAKQGVCKGDRVVVQLEWFASQNLRHYLRG